MTSCPTSGPQDLLKAWVFAQFGEIWPILTLNQTRIADCVSLFFESNGFVVLSGCPRCPSQDGGRDILAARSPSKLHVQRLGIGPLSHPCVSSSKRAYHPRGAARQSECQLSRFCRFLRAS